MWPGSRPPGWPGPAGGSGFQRWFEPVGALPNGRGLPYTSDWTDAFGNPIRVLAVANPRVTKRYHENNRLTRASNIMDQELKREGYGLVRLTNDQAVIECWPWTPTPPSPRPPSSPAGPTTCAAARHDQAVALPHRCMRAPASGVQARAGLLRARGQRHLHCRAPCMQGTDERRRFQQSEQLCPWR